MHLIYIDESGNTGMNLADAQQPVFVLCAMMVAEHRWQGLEQDLKSVIDEFFPRIERDGSKFEIHAAQLRAGGGVFHGMSPDRRIAFRDAWMNAGVRHGVTLHWRSIVKSVFAQWLNKTFGADTTLNPHIPAFTLLARVINNYLNGLKERPLGMFILDDNREIIDDVERAIEDMRGLSSNILRLDRIVEKGFFIDSRKSLPLQLCDLYAMSLRKHRERLHGLPKKPFDESGIALALSLVQQGDEQFHDVINWWAEKIRLNNKRSD